MREIEHTIREGAASAPCTNTNEVNVEDHLQQPQRILNVLLAPGSPHGEDPDASGRAPHLVSVHPQTTSTYENGVFSESSVFVDPV